MDYIVSKVDRFGERTSYRFYHKHGACMVVRVSHKGAALERPSQFTPEQADSFLRDLRRIGWKIEYGKNERSHR